VPDTGLLFWGDVVDYTETGCEKTMVDMLAKDLRRAGFETYREVYVRRARSICRNDSETRQRVDLYVKLNGWALGVECKHGKPKATGTQAIKAMDQCMTAATGFLWWKDGHYLPKPAYVVAADPASLNGHKEHAWSDSRLLNMLRMDGCGVLIRDLGQYAIRVSYPKGPHAKGGPTQDRKTLYLTEDIYA